jgi:hypothetical protein
MEEVHSAIGPIAGIRKDPLAHVALELPWSSLRGVSLSMTARALPLLAGPDHSLIQVDILAPKNRISLKRISVSAASFAISRNGDSIGLTSQDAGDGSQSACRTTPERRTP